MWSFVVASIHCIWAHHELCRQYFSRSSFSFNLPLELGSSLPQFAVLSFDMTLYVITNYFAFVNFIFTSQISKWAIRYKWRVRKSFIYWYQHPTYKVLNQGKIWFFFFLQNSVDTYFWLHVSPLDIHIITPRD